MEACTGRTVTAVDLAQGIWLSRGLPHSPRGLPAARELWLLHTGVGENLVQGHRLAPLPLLDHLLLAHRSAKRAARVGQIDELGRGPTTRRLLEALRRAS